MSNISLSDLRLDLAGRWLRSIGLLVAPAPPLPPPPNAAEIETAPVSTAAATTEQAPAAVQKRPLEAEAANIWKGPAQTDPSIHDEFDQYFAGMFP